MDEQRGSVRHAARYKQGYDHSSWASVLPRKITPSDIDVVFDNLLHGRQLFCEFTSREALWTEKAHGQRVLYQQILRTTNYSSACVLCFHSVPSHLLIDSLKDVNSFHVMRCVDGEVVYTPGDKRTFHGSLWTDFVKSFYGLENGFGTWA